MSTAKYSDYIIKVSLDDWQVTQEKYDAMEWNNDTDENDAELSHEVKKSCFAWVTRYISNKQKGEVHKSVMSLSRELLTESKTNRGRYLIGLSHILNTFDLMKTLAFESCALYRNESHARMWNQFLEVANVLQTLCDNWKTDISYAKLQVVYFYVRSVGELDFKMKF